MPRNAITIEVTAELIEMALKANSNHCMIADAIKAAIPDAQKVSVDLQTIRWSDQKTGRRQVFLTPLKCQQKLLMFDQGVEVYPWSFRLRTPVQVVPIRKGILFSVENPEGIGPERINPGPKKLKKWGKSDLVVTGGQAPPTAVLSNSRGQRRVFGVRVARGFDPSQPDTQTA